MTARRCLDEDVIPELARVLRAAGHDVISVHEVGAFGLSDEEQLARASAEGRALLSFNFRHFLVIARDWLNVGRSHAGIVVSYRQYRRSELRDLARSVTALLNSVSAGDLDNTVYVLDAFRRGLPGS